MGNRPTYYYKWIWLYVFFFITLPLFAIHPDNVLRRTIKLPKTNASRYELLEKITAETGYLFIYNSFLFDEDVKIAFPGGKYSLEDAIYLITENKSLHLRIVGNHILIQPTAPSVFSNNQSFLPDDIETEDWFTIDGHITDNYSHTPIPFVSIHITGTSLGTISNSNGNFRIRIPDSLLHSSLHFSHLGYHPLEIENEILKNGRHIFGLEAKVIPLQEVIIRQSNPISLIEKMLEQREKNLASAPVHLSTFYREGIEKRKTLLKLTEGVFKVHKVPFTSNMNDQVKLLRMRQYENPNENDTIITRMKAGIYSSLSLDVIKNLPDFLEMKDSRSFYTYLYSDLTTIDNRLANVITFLPIEHVDRALYTGKLFIDYENNALLKVEFEVDPKQVENVTSYFIEKKSRGLHIKAKKITYTISYKPWNGIYYINHIRGDLHFQVRKSKKFFSTSIHTWYEMVTCGIETKDIQSFNRKEVLYPKTIFSDTKYIYDPLFWGNFNTIIPEEDLSDALFRINAKIEELTE